MSHPDALIVGGGVIGAAAFHALSKDRKVMLVDRSRAAQGCTAWSGGIVRCFHDDSLLSDRAVVGFRYYHDFERHTGFQVPLVRTGFLFLPASARAAWSRQEVTRLAAHVPIEWLEAIEVRRRFHDLFADPLPSAAHEPEAGYMDAAEVTRAWLYAGQRNGGSILEGTEAINLIKSGGRVVGVQTNIGPLFAQTIILATGPQTPALLDRCSISHQLYRQDIQVDLRFPSPRLDSHPAFIDDEMQLNGRYDRRSGGIYVGFPTNQRNMPDRSALDFAHSVLISEVGARRFRWVAGSRLSGGIRSADCYSHDGRGQIGPVEGFEKTLFLASGFSGGGFKIAPWVAQELRRLICDDN